MWLFLSYLVLPHYDRGWTSPHFSPDSVARALVPAASALVPTLVPGSISRRPICVEKSLHTPGTSARATKACGV
jgi:hypothetical protein